MRKLPEPRMGDVWDVNFDPTVGREQGGVRPAIVVSNDAFNRAPHELCMVVPVTGTDRRVRLHLPIASPESGLTKQSFALCDQTRSASLRRLLRRRGRVEIATVRTIQAVIAEIIDQRY